MSMSGHSDGVTLDLLAPSIGTDVGAIHTWPASEPVDQSAPRWSADGVAATDNLAGSVVAQPDSITRREEKGLECS
jgi:hypothetical protein